MSSLDLNNIDAGKKYTYLNYLSWNFKEKVELLKGKIHQFISDKQEKQINAKLFKLIWPHLDRYQCEIFSAPFSVQLSNKTKTNSDTIVKPDICLICSPKNIQNSIFCGTPDLIIEIMSHASADIDFKEKRAIYEEYGVLEYWIVDPIFKLIHTYTMVNNQYYKSNVFSEKDHLSSRIFPKISFQVNQIFSV